MSIESEAKGAKYPKFSFLYIGLVTDREDPENLGRVRIKIEGLVDPTTWAFPLGVPFGGTAQRGFFAPPVVGAAVGVLFNQGDIEAPYYMPGFWGLPGGVSEVPTNAEIDGDDSGVYPMETKEWLIEIDDKNSVLRATHKSTGDKIELDSVARKATTKVDTTSVELDGAAKKATVDADGKTVVVDGAANKITLEAGTILLGAGAAEAVIKGDEFKTLYTKFAVTQYPVHFHQVIAVGSPTGPVLPPNNAPGGITTELSTKVKTE